MFELPYTLKQKCQQILGTKIQSVKYVGGGSINQARLLETKTGQYFLKMNSNSDAMEMFETEAKGLDLLSNSKTFKIPRVIALGKDESTAYLLLEFVETGYRKAGFWKSFGHQLAALHQHSAKQFGLDHHNFIGSLPQTNNYCETWSAFYANERLSPQIKLAQNQNRIQTSDIQSFDNLIKKLPNIFPNEPPALIHGDLWSGNFMVSSSSTPVLIDPSVSFSHREMDLAMSKLFGGFEFQFYQSYREAYPTEPGLNERIEIYQLYYLMVHVNLFGGGYINSVRSILNSFR